MKKFLAFALTAGIAGSSCCYAYNGSEIYSNGFENGISDFGTYYSGRTDTELPMIFKSENDGGMLEIVPVCDLEEKESKSNASFGFAYQGVVCNKYFALSDGESYTLSADILNGGNDKITACFILLNQNKVLGTSKKYEIESGKKINIEYNFASNRTTDKGKAVLALYNVKKDESVFADNFELAKGYAESWSGENAVVTKNGNTILISGNNSGYGTAKTSVLKSDLADETHVFEATATANEKTFLNITCPQIDLCKKSYVIKKGETKKIYLEFNPSDANGDTLVFEISAVGKTSAVKNLEMSDVKIKDALHSMSIKEENGKLTVSGRLKEGNAHYSAGIFEQTDYTIDFETNADGEYSFEIADLSSFPDDTAVNVTAKISANGYDSDITGEYLYISKNYKNALAQKVSEKKTVSEIAEILTEDVLDITGISAEPVFKSANQTNVFEYVAKTDVSDYDKLYDALITGACIDTAKSGEYKISDIADGYYDRFGFFENADVKTAYSSADKKKINEIFASLNLPLASKEDMNEKFGKSVVKYEVSKCANYSEGMKTVAKFADILGISLEKYNKVSETGVGYNAANEFVKYLKSSNDYSTSVLQDKLDTLCSQKQPSSEGGNGSSSSSSSSKGGAGTTAPSVPVINDTVFEFTDLDGADWAKTYIYKLLEKGVISESADKKFNPNTNITRAEFAKMASVLFNCEEYGGTAKFSDVSENDWYFKYVMALYKSGAVNGVSETEFAPNDYITRQDMCVILAKLANLDTGTADFDFADSADIAPYALGAVAAAKNNGIINGYSDNTFKPNAFATRAECAKMLCSTK